MNYKSTEKNAPTQVRLLGQKDAEESIRQFIAQTEKRGNTASGLRDHVYELLGEFQFTDSINLLPDVVSKFMSAMQKDNLAAGLKKEMGAARYDDLVQFLLRLPVFCNWMQRDEAAQAELALVQFEAQDLSGQWSPERFADTCKEYDLKTQFLKQRWPDTTNA